MQKQKRKAAQDWSFRGPKPFPLLSDPRFTDEQKEKELARLMQKLHYEFFQKQDMGHSQLPRARAMFYRTVADYTKLTGKDRPPDFDFEEIPKIAGSIAEIQEHDEDGDDEVSDDSNNVVLVGDSLPDCMKGCQGAGQVCSGNAEQWSAAVACSCYQAWQVCSLNLCSTHDRDADGFFMALNTRESEVCAWPKTKLYSNLHILEQSVKPADVTASGDGDDPGASSFLQDQHRRHLRSGLMLVPLLETPQVP
jgi:hypothetical protein